MIFKRKKCSKLDLAVAKKMCSLKHSAEARNLEFDLSFDTVRYVLSQKRCYYTGTVLSTEIGPCQLTVDRIDNDKGYVDGNVVAAAHWFNLKKGSLSVKEIKMLYNAIKHL